MKTRDFVSVSGVTNLSELRAVHEMYHREDLRFHVVIGYQVSHASMHEGTKNARQPRFSELVDLSQETNGLGFTTAIHYFSKDVAHITPDLEMIGTNLHARLYRPLVQFNTLPPSLDILKEVKKMGFRTIFKVAVAHKQTAEGGTAVWKGEGVEDMTRGNPQTLADQVSERAEGIDYAMFDPSHGTNIGLDLSSDSLAIRFGKELRRRNLNHMGLVYAGGIHPRNVEEVNLALARAFPGGFSIDVESGVRKIRKEGERVVEDILDLDLVREYLRNSQDNHNNP